MSSIANSREKFAASLALEDIFFANVTSACILFLNRAINYMELLELISSLVIDFQKLGLTFEKSHSILKPMGELYNSIIF